MNCLQHVDQPIDDAEVQHELDDCARRVGVKGAYWNMDIASKSDFLECYMKELENRHRPDDARRADVVRARIRSKLIRQEKERDKAELQKFLFKE